MDTQAILKAGGIGAGVLILLNLLGLIPCVNCITFILSLGVYGGIGVLAARFMTMPLNANSGALNGAIAAGIATIIAGIVNAVVQSLFLSLTGNSPLAQLPPEQLQALSEAGLDPTILASGGSIFVFALLCCSILFILAAGLGAAGGAFWGSRNPRGAARQSF